MDSVERASQRIEALADLADQPKPRRVGVAGSEPRPQLEAALELLKQERFTAALESMRTPSGLLARDPETLLLQAVLLTHSGQLENAAQACKDLLAIDDLNAGAQYLLALCCEGVGDKRGAVDHHQVAAYLDHCFAMPRLHLGLLARRAGDRETARRELGQALSLLQREEASRLLLFGGGFSREALVVLCRTELLAAGGRV
jgi:chemotaxis protein methyltransferase CheR